MSLDISLSAVVETDVFSANITHNLTKMADAAGIYRSVWRPDEDGIDTASQLAARLRPAIADMRANPDKYKRFDASNGWGTYEQFVPWLEELLEACERYPHATISTHR